MCLCKSSKSGDLPGVLRLFAALQSKGYLLIEGLRIIAALQEGLHFLITYVPLNE